MGARELEVPPRAGIELHLSGVPVLLYHGIGGDERLGSNPRLENTQSCPNNFSST